jgi:hypothetical protein
LALVRPTSLGLAAQGRTAGVRGADPGLRVCAHPLVDARCDHRARGRAACEEFAVAHQHRRVAQGAESAGALPGLDAGYFDLQHRRGLADRQLRGFDVEGQIVQQKVVLERHAELGVAQQQSRLADGLGDDGRVVAALRTRGEQRVAARPLRPDHEALLGQPFPADRHDLGERGAVHELPRNGDGEPDAAAWSEKREPTARLARSVISLDPVLGHDFPLCVCSQLTSEAQQQDNTDWPV